MTIVRTRARPCGTVGKPIASAYRTERPDIDKLRDALMQRAEQWKATLRAEPKVARLLLRRLVGPLTLWEESEGGVRWDAPISASSLLEGLVLPFLRQG